MVGEDIYEAASAPCESSWDWLPSGGILMPVRVETFAKIEEVARAMAASRSARFLGGGTLVMRAVNEGDQSFDTIVRSPTRLSARSARGESFVVGAGVTMAAILRSRDLAFLHPVARTIGGPPCVRWRPSAAICLPMRPTATSPLRCWHSARGSTSPVGGAGRARRTAARPRPRGRSSRSVPSRDHGNRAHSAS